MRNTDTIEREIDRARDDLLRSLTELKHTVQDRLDIKGRAIRAVERGKDRARAVAIRSKDSAIELAKRGRRGVVIAFRRAEETARDRPGLVVGLLVAAVLGVSVLFAIRRRRNRTWWRP